jgi:hypothetical protein
MSSSSAKQLRSPKAQPPPQPPQPQTPHGPLEKRGLVLGETIGVGAYAKVKLAHAAGSKRMVRCYYFACVWPSSARC